MARADIYRYIEEDPVYDPEWHWITDHVALGSYPLDPAIEELRDNGVRAILSVRAEHPDYDADVFDEALSLLVEDWVLFPYSLLVDGIRFIHRNVRRGNRVYVHCFAGMSRSVFLVCCYLMLTEGITFDEAVGRVRDIRPIANPHPGLWNQALLDRLTAERERILSDPLEEA